MLGLLRDPLWGFIGTVLCVVFGVAALIGGGRKDRSAYPLPILPRSTGWPFHLLWALACLLSVGSALLVTAENAVLSAPDAIAWLGGLCAALCLVAAIRLPHHPMLLLFLVLGQLEILLYALLGEAQNGGNYNVLVPNALTVTSTLALITAPLAVVVGAIAAAILLARHTKGVVWPILTAGGALGGLLLTFLLAWVGSANPVMAGVPVALAFFLVPLGSELYALFGS